MEIRKGPYGQFVINKIENIDSINAYTREIIAENIPGHMLPIYIIPTVSGYEASYDVSGMRSLNSIADSLDTDNLRKAVGDLFISIADYPDYLLSPSSVIFDERYLFIDEKTNTLMACFDPVMKGPEKLNIASLSGSRLNEFLNTDLMQRILKPEETDGIIYAIEQNDPDILRKQGRLICKPLPIEDKSAKLLEIPEFKMIILCALIALIFAILTMPLPSSVFFAGAAFFVRKTVKVIEQKPEIEISKRTDSDKRQMLFGDNNTFSGGLDSLILTSIDPISKAEEKKAIYTDKASIGSDRFLCDIYSPDKEISPIHAQITKSGRTYYVRDVSSDNTTFLDNIRLEAGQDYEIKSGQTLMCGKREYKIEIT